MALHRLLLCGRVSRIQFDLTWLFFFREPDWFVTRRTPIPAKKFLACA